MKIAVIQKFSQTTVSQQKHNNGMPISNPKPINTGNILSLYKTKGLNTSFGMAAKKIRHSGKYTKQLHMHESELDILRRQHPLPKSAKVIDAEDMVSRYRYWLMHGNDIQFAAYRKIAEELQKIVRDGRGFLLLINPELRNEIARSVMEEHFFKLKNYYCNGENKYNEFIKIVQEYNERLKMAEKKQLEKIEYLSENLSKTKEQLSNAAIKDDIIYTMNNQGGLYETIAGYDDIKKELQRTFIKPLLESIKTGNTDLQIPPAIMLYGAAGCGKTAILEAIREELKDFSNIVYFNPQSSNDFTGELFNILKDARIHYLKTSNEKEYGERTIILIDDAEKYLSESPENIDLSETLYSKTDIENLEKYNQMYNCPTNVNALKSVLDYISKVPENEKSEGCAATILLTTRYPHLIHRDLLSRDGEYGKMLSYAVRPAANNDLKRILQHYFSKVLYVVESIQEAAAASFGDEVIDIIPGITNKAKKVLNDKIKNNSIESLHINPDLDQLKNIATFINEKNPSLSKGAYSNARWKDIIYKAFIDYMENPEESFEKHFINKTKEYGVDITPKDYKRFENIYNMVENPEKYKQRKLVNISKKLKYMVDDYRDGLISDKDTEILKLKIQDIKRRYSALQNKENLSPAEKRIKNQYETFLNSVMDIEFTD